MNSPRATLCGLILKVLYRGIRVLSHADSQMRQELLQLPEGHIIRFAVSSAPEAPRLSFAVRRGSIEKAPANAPADIEIIFKNEKMAFRVFTGRMGIAGAYAAHAFTLRGNINEAMGVVRIVDLAENYLFPGFMARRILKHRPKKQYPAVLVYLRLIPAL